MKASLKFREEKQKPLFKAKVPLNILGLPFQSSISAGDSKELSLSLSTFFDSGPSFRVSYRPNDAFNPFSLLVKTGIGSFGSPINAPMTISAEFNFPVVDGNYKSSPAFFLHFKPQFGDFCIKKSHQSGISVFKNQNDSVFEDEDSSIEMVEKVPVPAVSEKIPAVSVVEEAVSGLTIGARTRVPIKNGAVLRMNWGVKFPEGFQSLFKGRENSKWTGGMVPRGVPRLVLNKIGIEHVAKEDRKEMDVGGPLEVSKSADVAEMCFGVKKQLEMMRGENVALTKALEDLRVEFGNSKGRGRGERKLGEREREIEGGVVDEMNNKS